MLKRNLAISTWLIVLPNLLLFYAALWIVVSLWYPEGLSDEKLHQHLISFSVIFGLWLITFFSFRLFERDTFRRYTTLFFSIVSAMAINLLVAIGYFYVQPALLLTPRRFLLALIIVTTLLILIWDLFLKQFLFSRFIQPVYLFSFNPELHYLEQEIANHSYLGFRVQQRIDQPDLKHLQNGSVVIFPDNLHTNQNLAETIFSFRNKGIIFFNHNSFYETLLRRVYIQSLDQIWFLRNITYQRNIFYHLLKRMLDLLLGVVLFSLFIISFPLVALIMSITSPGPVLFIQERIGLDGKKFRLYKYRTMTAGTNSNSWTKPHDQRITKFGKLLRISRIDELPQSINLIHGTMSLVGPRPEQVGIVQELKQAIPFYEERHIVKPGITGWAQLNIYATNLEESKLKLEYDLYYIKHQSLLFDIEIIVKTVYNILTLNGI